MTILVLAVIPGVVRAQSAPAPAAPAPAVRDSTVGTTLETLVRTIEAQQKQLDQQGRLIEQLQREIAETRALAMTAKPSDPAGPEAPAAPATPPLAVAQESSPDPPPKDDRPDHTPELPGDVVSAGAFPGSFKVPGSDAAMRIGGMVRVNWVNSFNALLVDDRFQASAIPAAGTPESLRGGRVNVIASPSRFNLDLRTPTGVGYMRSFVEGDFAGGGNTLRLRHAYGQWRRIVFGQTWSTFSDPEAQPDGIDFEGMNAIVLFRQPQIRWSFAVAERLRLAIALEDPDPDLTGATGVNRVPDFVTRLRWEPKRGGHVQFSGLVRQLRGEPTNQPNQVFAAGGYGLNISGRLPIKFWGERDQLRFQHNSGRGIGRYILDLRSLGGQDGVFDPASQQLLPLDVLSGYVAYEHWWAQRLRSSITFGVVSVNNLEVQTGDSLSLTTRSSINFIWSPIGRLDLVSELLWGERRNKDDSSGRAMQMQVGSTFRF